MAVLECDATGWMHNAGRSVTALFGRVADANSSWGDEHRRHREPVKPSAAVIGNGKTPDFNVVQPVAPLLLLEWPRGWTTQVSGVPEHSDMTEVGLQFMEGGDKVSPTGCVRQYEDVGHETIVRELAQNALDAARTAKRKCELRFEIRSVPTASLPGIATYRHHLADDGMKVWKERGQAKYDTILKRLRDLSQRAATECLMVYDNGIGLNAETMEGLIGKGDTMKREDDGGSGGAHGVGHETAFAAGDMNYVMYGGVHRNDVNRRVASGHVVFPTHIRNCRRYGGHGYLSSDVGQLTLSGVSIIDNRNQIPSLVNKELDGIEALSGSGSVVIIPAFNRFPESGGTPSEDCCELICEDIAKHFFVAIAQDRLTLKVQDCSNNGGGRTHTC